MKIFRFFQRTLAYAYAGHACIGGGVQAADMEPGFRVVTFGTSLTARGGWQDALAASLEKCIGREVTVEKVAESGAASDWAVTEIDRVIALQPDVILVEFSTNDAALNRLFTIGSSLRNMEVIFSAFQQRLPEARVISMAMNPVHGLRGIMRPYLDSYIEAHRRLALDRGFEFFDNRPAWGKLSQETINMAIPDGAHPLPEWASIVIVPGITDKILPECRKRE
jgi:lysophospholipase L1-like esterase